MDPSHVVILGIPLTFEGIDRGLMGLALVMTICIRRCRRCDEDIQEWLSLMFVLLSVSCVEVFTGPSRGFSP